MALSGCAAEDFDAFSLASRPALRWTSANTLMAKGTVMSEFVLGFAVYVLPGLLTASIVLCLIRGFLAGGIGRAALAMVLGLGVVLSIGAAATWKVGIHADHAIAACEDRIRQGELLYDCEDEGLIVALPLFNTFVAVCTVLVGSIVVYLSRRGARQQR